jgi:hypothetical protein
MYVRIYLFMYVCMCACMYVFEYVSKYVCMYVWMNVRMYICIYICMYVCVYVCMYVWMYVCMYVYMWVCAQIQDLKMQPKTQILINCSVLDTATLLKSKVVEGDRAGSKLLEWSPIMVSLPLSCLKVTNDLAYYAMAIWTSGVTIF